MKTPEEQQRHTKFTLISRFSSVLNFSSIFLIFWHLEFIESLFDFFFTAFIFLHFWSLKPKKRRSL